MNEYTLDWVWNLTDIKRTEKLVLLLLAYEAGDGSVLTIAKKEIARKCDISKRTVDECIRQLVMNGHLTIHTHTVGRKSQPAGYMLHPVSILGTAG